MAIVYKDVIQGTPDWAALRCGIPTASQFHRLLTPTGKPSKSAQGYLFELLAERITGEPTVAFTSHWMDRGNELEASAVNFYEMQTDCDTEKVGFVTNDASTIGASPDRLVGESGLLEIKVCKPSTHVGFLLTAGAAFEEYKIQTLGQLWIAEREFNDLLAYNPGMPPVLVRVERDEDFIKLLEKEVTSFSNGLEDLALDLQARGWIAKPKAREYSTVEMLRESLRDLQKETA